MTKVTKEELSIAKKVWDKVFGMEYTVESMDYYRKQKGIKYVVKKHGDGHWTCNCKSWIFSCGTYSVRDRKVGKVFERTCKHIRFVMEKEGMKI